MPTDLWTFATALYERPGVAEDCLMLQERGANVCLLLCAAWLEQRQVACTGERLAHLRSIVEPWEGSVVSGVRTLRQQWRADAQNDSDLAQLREQVKAIELAAERILLQRLEQLTGQWPGRKNATPWLESLLAGLEGGSSVLPRLRTEAQSAGGA